MSNKCETDYDPDEDYTEDAAKSLLDRFEKMGREEQEELLRIIKERFGEA